VDYITSGTVLNKKTAVAWIQSFLEPVCGGGQMQGQASPIWKKRASWNPAEMVETWEKAKKNPFETWCRRISGQQSEKIAIHQILYKSDSQLVRYVAIVFLF
jgi:hypothetical protein